MKEGKNKNEFLVQITSGRGPEECWRVVAKVLELFLKEAKKENLLVQVVETVPGSLNATLLSATVLVKGDSATHFISQWEGSIQWIAQSPFRKFHKRKNWFVGVTCFNVSKLFQWNDKDVVYETLRASGPGGQHVNKTESAVRATHVPSGISVVASERRSQFQNKSEALERLKNKVSTWHLEQAAIQSQGQWQKHNDLERGNAVKTFNERL
jgi:peptide chain release factor